MGVSKLDFPRIDFESLADAPPSKDKSATIDTLIGNHYYFEFVTEYRKKIKPRLFLIGSHFGQILTGRLSQSFKKEQISLLHLCAHNLQDNELEQFNSVKNFWSLETLGITNKERDDKIAQNLFHENVKFEGERYSGTWPWKEGKASFKLESCTEHIIFCFQKT